MIKIEKINKLSSLLKSLPGVGPKMAERMAYHILQSNSRYVSEFINTLKEIESSVVLCRHCLAPSEKAECDICSDNLRDHSVICVIEKIEDLVAIEKTRKYNGVYHILGGILSPTEGIGPGALHIEELIARFKNGAVKEIIIATNPTTEGDITANYIADLLKEKNVKLTRIGYGLPVGGSFEYADEITIMRSMEARKEIHSQ